MFKTQFFDQNIDPIMKFVISDKHDGGTPSAGTGCVNGEWTSRAAGSAGQLVVYKTFTIGLNMTNQLFDIKNKFYTAAFTKQTPRLSLKLQPYKISQLFFTDTITSAVGTGLTELELYCYIKQSSVLPSEMADKGEFTQTYHKYVIDALTLSGGYGRSSTFLSSGHDSTNDVILCLSTPDVNRKDSCYLKQRYTLFNST